MGAVVATGCYPPRVLALLEVLVDGVAAAPAAVDPRLVRVLLAPWAGLGAFAWGALWGSFANVVIWRVPRGMSVVRPGSACTACGAPVAWYDNLPIASFLALRGRCRRCGEALSIRYLVVEVIGAALSFALYMAHVVRPLLEGGAPGLAAWLLWFVFGLALVIVTYTDLDLWVIPSEIVLPVAALGIACAALSPATLGVGVAEAAGAAAGAYGLIALLRGVYLRLRGIEALGLGDAKLLAMVGAFCGAAGAIWTVAAGAIQGLVVAVPMLLLGKRLARSDLQEVHGDDPELGEEDEAAGVMGVRVPFGPFLALAAIEYMLFGESLVGWLRGG